MCQNKNRTKQKSLYYRVFGQKNRTAILYQNYGSDLEEPNGLDATLLFS